MICKLTIESSSALIVDLRQDLLCLIGIDSVISVLDQNCCKSAVRNLEDTLGAEEVSLSYAELIESSAGPIDISDIQSFEDSVHSIFQGLSIVGVVNRLIEVGVFGPLSKAL